MEYRTRQKDKERDLPALQRLGRFLRLKQYQIEVTFGVYMFTPVEKFVFWSVVFLLFSLFVIATILYLPQHIVFIFNRAWYYAIGRESGAGAGPSVAGAAKDALSLSVSATSTTAEATANAVVREL
jgi:hypothetical protein